MVDTNNNENSNENNISLCMEVLEVLKRCFDSDAPVKCILYQVVKRKRRGGRRRKRKRRRRNGGDVEEENE